MESQLHFDPNLIKLDEALAEVDRAGMDVACAAPMLDGRAAFDAASKFIVARRARAGGESGNPGMGRAQPKRRQEAGRTARMTLLQALDQHDIRHTGHPRDRDLHPVW